MNHIVTLAGDSLVRSIVSWSVGFVMGTFVVRGVRGVLRKIVDLLDTATPGGLTDVIEAVESNPRRLR